MDNLDEFTKMNGLVGNMEGVEQFRAYHFFIGRTHHSQIKVFIGNVVITKWSQNTIFWPVISHNMQSYKLGISSQPIYDEKFKTDD